MQAASAARHFLLNFFAIAKIPDLKSSLLSSAGQGSKVQGYFIGQHRIIMRRYAGTCLFFLFINIGLANPVPGPVLGPPIGFDIKKANQQFDHINLQLSVQNLDIDNLDQAVETLSSLVNKSEECVEDVQKKISNIDNFIKQGGAQVSESKKEGADFIYLNKQHKELANQRAQCRLFTIRAKEAIEAYKNAIAELKQEQALTRGMPLWSIISQTIDAPPETKLTTWLSSLPAILPSFASWIIALFAASFSAIIILQYLRKSQFARHKLHFKKIYFHSILLLSAFFISGFLFTYLLTSYQSQTALTLPLLLSGMIFSFLFILVVLSFLFRINVIRACFYWYSLDISFFKSMLITSLGFYTLGGLAYFLSNTFNTNSPLWQLCSSLFLLVILSTTGHYIFDFCKRHHHTQFVKNHYQFIRRITLFMLFTCAIINIFGYYTLAYNLTFSGFTTFIIIFSTLFVTQSINKFYLQLSQQETYKNKIIQYFGYRPDQTFTEFLILKAIAQLIVIMISIYLIGQSWGFATDYIEIIYDRFLYGVHLANITIYPTRLISGIIVFCALYLLFRAISNAISSQQQFEDEEETQVAVASILTYIGFALAVISGFLVAGFDFTGLAIIAGALSVGIGLGLQSIVNNFVSGLILLIEKPIRPGDRINVDGIEGFVKKIRVRSTQIVTTAREDIIVPNSDLITHRVTNYMFSDKYYRINCEVGVAYGSDTTLVREVLLNLANEHEEVIKTGRNKPIVLLRSFGDSNLVFQLWFLIKDVNKKFIVRSDLNFAIEKAFREHKICMAFAQRDVNLKISDLDIFKKDSEAPSN